MNKESLESTLKTLFIQCMDGDANAYEDFLALCSVMVKKYLQYLGHRSTGSETLEDLHQDVMMSVHQKRQTYRLERPMLPWIYSITRYRYIDFYRNRKTSPKMMEFSEERIQKEEEEGFGLDDLFELLTPRQKEMIQMVKLDGESYVDAAKAFGLSVPALKVSVHRIVRSLQEKLKK